MRLLFLLTALAPFASCADFLVAAASDLSPFESTLKPAMERLIGTPVRFSFQSSVQLRQQIAQGAPFDLFLSADEDQVRIGLRDGWLEHGSERLYARGRIGLWSANGSITKVEQLTNRNVRHIAIANPKFAPYGRAAREALQRAGVWPKVSDRIVYGENVRQAYLYAKTGSADVAIVAWSLIANEGGVLLPEELHAPVRQFGAVVSSSKRAGDARKVLAFLAGPEGAALLKQPR